MAVAAVHKDPDRIFQAAASAASVASAAPVPVRGDPLDSSISACTPVVRAPSACASLISPSRFVCNLLDPATICLTCSRLSFTTVLLCVRLTAAFRKPSRALRLIPAMRPLSFHAKNSGGQERGNQCCIGQETGGLLANDVAVRRDGAAKSRRQSSEGTRGCSHGTRRRRI